MFNYFKNLAVKKAYKAVEPLNVIRVEKGLMFLGEDLVSANELNGLKDEVYKIEQMRVWKIMMSTLRADAIERGLTKSTSFDDVLVAKAMLVCLDVQESILNNIRNRKV